LVEHQWRGVWVLESGVSTGDDSGAGDDFSGTVAYWLFIFGSEQVSHFHVILYLGFNAQHRAGIGASGLPLQDVGMFLRMKRGC
jgi:hypothetical protein